MSDRWGSRIVLLAIGIFFLLMSSCKNDVVEPAGVGKLLTAQRFNDPGIYDAQGRFMLLRGVNLNTLGDYWEANPAVPATAPYEADHFRLMAKYGFNVVRLLIHWSAIEPTPGNYDQAYIARIRQAIEDASEHNIYVMLDMHQDAWGKYIATPPDSVCEFPSKGWDGAPEWATITDGATTCGEGSRESNPAMHNAFRNFWLNTDGIQDAFIAAWQEVVRATAGYEMVVGYDAFNEPSLGNGDFFNQGAQYNFFLKKLVEAIREAEREVGGYEHIYFFETTVTWAGEELPFTPAFDFTNDHNIVFAPHNYFEVITPVLTIEEGADLYENLAGLYGTHCFIGEWGVFGNPASDFEKLKRFAEAEDSRLMGSTWWQWCQAPGDPHGINWAGDSYAETSFHLMQVDVAGNYTGNLNTDILQILGRARPLAIHGKPIRFESDPDTGSMMLEARASAPGHTELWIPGHFGEPIIGGTGVIVAQRTEVEGGYIAKVAVVGRYLLEVHY